MNKVFRYLLFIVFGICSFYYAWSEGNRTITEAEYLKFSEAAPSLVSKSIGYDHKAGNVIAFQVFMNVMDYSTPERFFEKLDSYIMEAKRKGYVNEGTIFLFPEHIGTSLVLLNEKKDVYSANSFSSAFKLIGLGNLISYFRVISSGTNIGNGGEVIFKMKASEMKSVYQNTFSKLSNLYGVTIIAGSILLPEPEVSQAGDEILIKNGKINNSGFIFLPDGKIFSKILKKKNLGETEKLIASESEEDVSVLEFKNIGIVFSNDTLYNSVYGEKFKNKEILLAPSVNLQNEEINWSNKDIFGEKEAPSSSSKKEENWKNFGIFEKTKLSAGNRAVIQVFLLGDFYELSSKGESSALIRYVAGDSLGSKNPGILNIWF